MELLSEDNCEVLRVGERGDELVTLEDRLITNSLNQYKGKDKERVSGLFSFFAVFPEDVPIPEQLLRGLVQLLLRKPDGNDGNDGNEGNEGNDGNEARGDAPSSSSASSLPRKKKKGGVTRIKRPALKMRSWLTALLRCSLLCGSPKRGFYQHDIVRHYAITRHRNLRATQRAVVQALLDR